MPHDPTASSFRLPLPSSAIRWLLVANAVVFVANALLLGRLSDPRPGGGAWFACSWDRLWDGYGLGLLRLGTYQFTHAFADPLHFLLNALVLWFFGPMVEERLGARETVRFYLLGGVAGALLHLGVAALQGEANVPLVGASGACYAFLLYAACVAPRAQVILFVIPLPLWGLAALLVGIGVYSTFVEFATGFTAGTAHGAHLGGAAFGAAAWRWGFGTRPAWGLWAAWARRAAVNRALAEQRHQAELDAVLAKVKAHGLPSLTKAERRVLARASAAAAARRGS
ncbi:MAG: rhomboid family intramembrane serine protease [Planctomycetes bacterium]|nr:rhomboid family intramembrane serine protease [Planctomycetota bacterium]